MGKCQWECDGGYGEVQVGFGGSKDAKGGFANLVIGDVGAADDHRRRNGWEELCMEG